MSAKTAETATLNAKLLKFQALGLSVKKDAKNPAFKSKYASLSEIIETINPGLTGCGLLVSSRIQDGQLITSVIDAETGESLSASFPIFGNKPQELGSSITYARRYNLGALLNLHIDDDDDGNAANSAPAAPKWYNDVEDNLETWTDLVRNGKGTPQGIIEKIETAGYQISKRDKEKILAIK